MRNRISEAARTIFQAEGVAGISMRRIASEVGVTPPAIYRHFTNKEALVSALVDEGFAILETNMRRAVRGSDGRDALLSLLDSYIDFAIAYPRYFDCMFQTRRADVRSFPGDLKSRKSDSFNVVVDLVTASIDDGELNPDDALEVALTIWSQAHGLASLYCAGRFGDHPVRFRRIARRAMQRLFLGLDA